MVGCFLFLDNLLPRGADSGYAGQGEILSLVAVVPPPGLGLFAEFPKVLELETLVPMSSPTVDGFSVIEMTVAPNSGETYFSSRGVTSASELDGDIRGVDSSTPVIR